MKKINGIEYYTDDEMGVFINTALFNYYQKYVEPLEREHDDLLDECEYLRTMNKWEQTENERMRKMNKDLMDKLKNSKLVNIKMQGGKRK